MWEIPVKVARVLSRYAWHGVTGANKAKKNKGHIKVWAAVCSCSSSVDLRGCEELRLLETSVLPQ